MSSRTGGCLCGAVRYVDDAQGWERPEGAPAFPRGYPETASPPAWR